MKNTFIDVADITDCIGLEFCDRIDMDKVCVCVFGIDTFEIDSHATLQ